MSDMMQFFGQDGFDGIGIEAQPDYILLPPGPQPIEIKIAEVRETKAKTGHYIKLDGLIFEGPQKGQHVFDQINIDNPSEVCVQIGQRVLKALKEALGLQTITNTDQFLGGRCIAHVKVKDGMNNVRTYSPYKLQADPTQEQAPPPYGTLPPAGPPQDQEPSQTYKNYTQPQQPIHTSQQPQQPAQFEATGKPPWQR